ncbi:MAG: SDR family oxidoreductase [Planctomycetes bacterium]|nr:SDR family oxidoreductase [Planctomycetota bacterium]
MRSVDHPLALVTGGSGGIGAAIVRRLAAAGFPVAFTHLGQVAESAALCAELGRGARAFESDCADEAAVAELYRQVRPQVLVHCAGVSRDRPIWRQDLADFDAVVGVNLRGAWLQVRAAAPGMREAGWGRVVLIGSINGSRGKFGQTTYAASKAGLHGLAKSAAKELGDKGVTVNVVEPGWIDTPMTLAVPPMFRRAALEETVTNRLGQPDDVAAAVVFLCGRDARQITGQVIRVDGGQLL